MKIKRFMARNMREAIRQVREEQGPDSVILSNRRVPGGIEIVAAVDYDEALMQQSLHRAGGEPAVANPSPTASDSVLPPPQPAPAPRSDAAVQQLLTEFGQLDEAEPEVVETAPAPSSQAAPKPAADGSTISSDGFQKLQRELGSMRRMIEQQLAGIAWGELKRNRPIRYSVLKVLADLGISPDLAREICDAMPEGSNADRARFLPLGLLASRIPVTRKDVLLDGGMIALVGPTGVGKTTTIAKLAARYAERHGVRDIALVAMDQYRVGAQEQLYTYGRLLGVPVFSMNAQHTLPDTLAKLSDHKLVLIDTAGMSQRDEALISQLNALNQAHPRLRNYLVLAANSQSTDLDDIAQRFAPANPVGCIVTKLDETTRVGGAISTLIQHQLPLAYITDGQRVPEDIKVAAADKLVLQAMRLARLNPVTLDDDYLAVEFNPASTLEGALHA